MIDPLAAALGAALAAPTGARLEQVFHSPFVTVLLAERDGGETSAKALEFARDALVRRGVAAGRQMVLLAAMDPPRAEHREWARLLRARLGVPVLIHDPAQSPSMPAVVLDGMEFELDDELREAEAVMLVAALRPGARFGEAGGAELLVPGAASAATAARCAARAQDPAERYAIVRRAQEVCRIDYALLWSHVDPSRAWAGEPPGVLEVSHAALGERFR